MRDVLEREQHPQLWETLSYVVTTVTPLHTDSLWGEETIRKATESVGASALCPQEPAGHALGLIPWHGIWGRVFTNTQKLPQE